MNTSYTPPFTISANAINLLTRITALTERLTARLGQADKLTLRKVNRVKTIHSSLAIEGNTLSENEVRDMINGKTIVAPLREIQEVKNAIKAYELYPTLDPFNEQDLLKAHHVMMEALVERPGRYRTGGVGVLGQYGFVHIAPPAHLVPTLMANLFSWLKHAKDNIIIRSCVFHYEFEFIHPFDDGNGRIGRLWQSLILGKLNPIFEHLPVENMVYANQQTYYEAISNSSNKGDCSPFIDFMLNEILKALLTYELENSSKDVGINVGTNVGINVGINERRILNLIAGSPQITIREIAELSGISTRHCERLIAGLKRQGLLMRIGPNKNGHWIIPERN